MHIEYGAFEDSKLKEIELPQNLYSIGRFAFDIPSLKKLLFIQMWRLWKKIFLVNSMVKKQLI